eukprot:364283-Chlamydomonas_euryale.AAC.9
MVKASSAPAAASRCKCCYGSCCVCIRVMQAQEDFCLLKSCAGDGQGRKVHERRDHTWTLLSCTCLPHPLIGPCRTQVGLALCKTPAVLPCACSEHSRGMNTGFFNHGRSGRRLVGGHFGIDAGMAPCRLLYSYADYPLTRCFRNRTAALRLALPA